MSSNKRLCLRSSSLKKSSFGERICDDLSEVILQYLSLEDKLRLECVSKQFQSTVFEKVYGIELSMFKLTPFNFNVIAFESVLKKCPQINSIFSKHDSYLKLNGKAIDLIVKYCQNLVEMDSHLLRNSKIPNKLLRKIDTKLFTINLIRYEWHRILTLRSLSHIQEFQIQSIYRRNNPSLFKIKGFKNLKTVSVLIRRLYSEDIQYLQTFIQNNKKLKSLEVMFPSMDSKEINILLNEISKLKHLIQLKISTKIGLNEKQLKEGLNKIGLNCKLLKSFGFTFNSVSNNSKEIIEFLSDFKALKRITLRLTQDNSAKQMFSMQLFKGCEHLTHLTLIFNRYNSYSDVISDTILININKYLPNLQFLEIRNKIKATDGLAHILSGLTKLQTIKMDLLSDSVEDSTDNRSQQIRDQIINECKKVRFIQLKDETKYLIFLFNKFNPANIYQNLLYVL